MTCDDCNRHGPYENTTEGQFAYITQGYHREQHAAMGRLVERVNQLADAMREGVGTAAARLAEALAPHNFISIHPDTIRRMHAAATHRGPRSLL